MRQLLRMESSRPSDRPDFQRLRVWQEAMALAAAALPLCRALRQQRRWHLADQIARATTSVHANIAEGNGRRSPRDRARVLQIARGSLFEVESLLVEAALEPSIDVLTASCRSHVIHTARLLAAMIHVLDR